MARRSARSVRSRETGFSSRKQRPPVSRSSACSRLRACRSTGCGWRASPYADGAAAGGGAGMIAAQADCPFQAVARHRLRTECWPEPLDGLSALERGILVHAALAAFWQDVVDHATLIAMPPDVFARHV